MAFDSGTWVVRSWSFFVFPAFSPLNKDVSYYSVENSEALVWVDSNTVMITDIHEPDARPRQCGYDPCGNSSVVLYSVSSGTTTPVLAGTDLCDYQLLSFDGAKVTAAKKCAKNVEDWADTTIKSKFTLSTETTALPVK